MVVFFSFFILSPISFCLVGFPFEVEMKTTLQTSGIGGSRKWEKEKKGGRVEKRHLKEIQVMSWNVAPSLFFF